MDPSAIWIGWLVLFLVYELYAAKTSSKGDTLSETVWKWVGVRGPRRSIVRRLILLAFLTSLTSHLTLGTTALPVIVCGAGLVVVIGWSVIRDRPAIGLALALPFLLGGAKGCGPKECERLAAAVELACSSSSATACEAAKAAYAANCPNPEPTPTPEPEPTPEPTPPIPVPTPTPQPTPTPTPPPTPTPGKSVV